MHLEYYFYSNIAEKIQMDHEQIQNLHQKKLKTLLNKFKIMKNQLKNKMKQEHTILLIAQCKTIFKNNKKNKTQILIRKCTKIITFMEISTIIISLIIKIIHNHKIINIIHNSLKKIKILNKI